MFAQRIARTAALALAVAALAAPAAGAQSGQDLRNPDRRVSPINETGGQDLRSADARDAAAGRGTFNAPQVTVVRLPETRTEASGGLDWMDAGIGAGAVIAVVLLGLGSVAAIAHRRHAAAPPTVTG